MEENEPQIERKEPDVINSHDQLQDENKDKDTNAGEVGNIEKQENFEYLEPREREDSQIFDCKSKENNVENDAENIFKPHAIICKYAICILLKEDNSKDSLLLKSTIDSIMSNYGDLTELGINPENIIIYVFVSKNKLNKLIAEEDIKGKLKGENKNKYLLSHFKYKNDGRDIKIEVVSKKNYMSNIESLKCFYLQIVNNLKNKNKILITSVITAGVTITNSALYDLIQSCVIDNDNNNNQKKSYDCVSVPCLGVDDSMETGDIFGKIIKYEQAHFNIYDMNYYKSTGIVPVLSLFNTMSIDQNLENVLLSFYTKIDILDDCETQKIDYHDYNLGLFLYQNHINIKYLNRQNLGTIHYRDFDYKYLLISKYSGYYSNFFDILKTLINFDLPIIHKIFTLFQIIGMLIEFVYPGLSILVIYSIFIEAFDIRDRYPACFMTMLYIIMYLGSGVNSLISQKTKETLITSHVYYYFMEIYYLFIIVCSVPAMDNIKKKKLFGEKYDTEEFYKFNVAACACLIIFTFILGILPMIFRIDMIISNIVSMILYLILGVPTSTSNLLIAKIWNAPGASGGITVDDRKGITILFFLLSNLFFGFLSVYIYDRKTRANCVMGLAIFYLIYLFFKIIGIILALFESPDLSQKKSNKIQNILNKSNIFESKNSNDHINEERLDNENENENNEDNQEVNSKNKDENEDRNDNNEQESRNDNEE